MLQSLKNIEQRVGLVLAKYPDARNDDKLLIKLYWEEFDKVKSLNDIVDATPPETIMRVRRKLNEKGKYLPTDPEVLKRRRLYQVLMRKNIKAI